MLARFNVGHLYSQAKFRLRSVFVQQALPVVLSVPRAQGGHAIVRRRARAMPATILINSIFNTLSPVVAAVSPTGAYVQLQRYFHGSIPGVREDYFTEETVSMVLVRSNTPLLLVAICWYARSWPNMRIPCLERPKQQQNLAAESVQ